MAVPDARNPGRPQAATPQPEGQPDPAAERPEDQRLDEALAETFPASDPVALTQPAPGPPEEHPEGSSEQGGEAGPDRQAGPQREAQP